VLKDSPAEAKRSLSTLSNDRRITLGGATGAQTIPRFSAAVSASAPPRAIGSTALTTYRRRGGGRSVLPAETRVIASPARRGRSNGSW
jgi:hypothetical protein